MSPEKPPFEGRLGHDETIGSFLTRLAARSAAPGGGATGALHAAQAAALLAMVARFSDGPRYDAETVGRVRAAADGLADEGVALAAKILQQTAKDLGPLGKDPEYGAGLVDAYQAILAVQPSAAAAGQGAPQPKVSAQ